MLIEVKRVRLGVRGEYIGRRGYGREGSPLGNDFRIGRDGTRDEVIAKFDGWLGAKIAMQDRAVLVEMERLAQIAKSTGRLVLLCYCAPEPCHGDVIARVLREQFGVAA